MKQLTLEEYLGTFGVSLAGSRLWDKEEKKCEELREEYLCLVYKERIKVDRYESYRISGDEFIAAR